MSGRWLLLTAIACFGVFILIQNQNQSTGLPCFIKKRYFVFNTKYFQNGDIIIGGIFTVHRYHNGRGFRHFCYVPLPNYYRYVLTFIFAIDEINKNPNILPNVTLGYHMYDSCNCASKAVESVLQILSGSGKTVPNYSCQDHYKLAGVIGDQTSESSLHVFEILNIYGYTQISYGATDPLLTNKHLYPSFFQTLPSDQTQYLAIAKLLKHFGWTCIGVITSPDYGGEKSSQELKKAAAVYDICVEYIITIDTERIEERPDAILKEIYTFKNSTSKVVVLCSISLITIKFIGLACDGHHDKTLIVPAGPILHILFASKFKTSFHGSLVFSPSAKKIPNLKIFLDNISTSNHPNDLLQEHILAMYFNCHTSNMLFSFEIENAYKIKLQYCNRSVKLNQLGNNLFNTEKFGTAYHIYKAVYAMAHALHEMQLYLSKYPGNSYPIGHRSIKKYFVPRIRFQDPLGEEVYFNEKGEMTNFYNIHSYAILSYNRFLFKKFAVFNASLEEGEALVVNKTKLYWKHGMVPISQCSEDCPNGYRRTMTNAMHWCFFSCVKCSDGEISNETDKVSCIKCPEDQWPNDKNQCVPKPTDFLSYSNDPITIVTSIISLIYFVKTFIILVIFIVYRDTPVTKANNQSLSFLILVSIMLNFLCVFLFIGRPTHASCLLRHTSYGIISSVAMSCILAKTIMVYLAFKATKPGSCWRKCIQAKFTYCVVFVFSSSQALICLIWLSISPPFPEMNTHSCLDKIIIQCNEGSMVAFSLLLGYMGLLAAVAFIMAFLARNLPDSYNEAKYITFSMLVFCSVWIAFIPAYMSVTGKNTVLVEIFAIISSNVGILACIFFTKCYIILMRPDLNTKNILIRHTN